MDIFITVVTLASSLAVGITIGARLARASLGFLPSLWIQIGMFFALSSACVYFADRPQVLASIVCALVSTFAFWIARKTAPDTVPVSSGYSAPEVTPAAGPSKPTAHQGGKVFTPAPSQWSGSGRRKNPGRKTPTGKIIFLVSSTDTIPPGKRGTGKLRAVK